MTKSITKVQYMREPLTADNPREYWMVTLITPEDLPSLGEYVRIGGDVGGMYRFFTKEAAQIAEKLFHTRNESDDLIDKGIAYLRKKVTSAEKGMNRFCEDCNNWATCTKKVIRMVSFCSHFVPKLSTESEMQKFKAENIKETSTESMREFESGATRNTVEGRLDYTKALSPIVLERYVQYLNAHRRQADGSMRDFDNWKKGIPTDVYLAGLGRHFISVWMLAQGFPAEDNKGPVTLEDSLCAIIFGASGWLHEIIKEKRSEQCGI